jgi:S-formylglutathione hydrolase
MEEAHMKRLESHACFGGRQESLEASIPRARLRDACGVYLPPQAAECAVSGAVLVVGADLHRAELRHQGGAQRYAAEHGIILVVPDTSPRGEDVADAVGYDLGQGAGFYVNATQAPWSAHYRMYDYVAAELPQLVETHFPASDARAISGHSMGGHGALVIALRNPGRYRSVSAFSPIVAPIVRALGRAGFRRLSR